MNHSDPPPAACAGLSQIFDSPTVFDHTIAVRYCLGDPQQARPVCPRLALCRTNTPTRADNHDGTWAGDLYHNGIKIREAGRRIK